MKRLLELMSSPTFSVRFNAIATLIWFALIVPSILWWSNSVSWIVFMSLYANIAASWAAYNAAMADREMKERQKS